MSANSEVAGDPAFNRPSAGLALFLALGTALVPLWLAEIPPMLDYHNHLARQYILAGLPNSSHLQEFYLSNWRFIPYLAMDGTIQALSHFMPVAIAGKVFLSLMFFLLALAPIGLGIALFGRVTPVSLLGLLMVHNHTVTLGFVSYLFSVGFAICLLALWISLRESRSRARWPVFLILSLLLFLSHLLGFLVYGMTVVAYELGRHIEQVRSRTPRVLWSLDSSQWRNAVLIAVQLSLPFALYAILADRQPTQVFGSNTYGGIERKLELLWGMFSYLIPPYSWTLDRFLAVGIPMGVVALLVLRKLEFARSMILPVLALLLFFLAMPMEFIGGWGADHRLLVPLGLVLAGSVSVISVRRLAWNVIAGVVGIVVVVRVAAISSEWQKANREYREFAQAFEVLTDGSKLFYAFGHEAGQKIWLRPEYHLPQLAVMTRHVYVPFLFVGTPGTLKYRPEVEPLQRLSPGPVLTNRQSPDWAALIGKFDYILVVDENFFELAAPKELRPVFKGPRVTVYKGPSQ